MFSDAIVPPAAREETGLPVRGDGLLGVHRDAIFHPTATACGGDVGRRPLARRERQRLAVAAHPRVVHVAEEPHDRRAIGPQTRAQLELGLIAVAVQEIAVEVDAVRDRRHLKRPEAQCPALVDPFECRAARIAARVRREIVRGIGDERPIEKLGPRAARVAIRVEDVGRPEDAAREDEPSRRALARDLQEIAADCLARVAERERRT